MATTTTENVERLQPIVDSVLSWLCSSKKLLYLCSMLHCCWDFGWFTFVAQITNQPFPLWDLEVQSILIPGHFISMLICAYLSAAVKKSNVMCAGRLRTGYPDNFVILIIKGYFVRYSCMVVLVGVPFAVQFGPEFIHFPMNTIYSAQVCSLWFKWAKLDLLCFWALNSCSDLLDSISAKLLAVPPSSWHDMLSLI